jgi:FlaA1/EpsC-like NDP-sugar epimerase
MTMDAVLLAGGFTLNFVFWLTFKHGNVPAEYWKLYLYVIAPIVEINLLLFWGLGLYRSIARHTGIHELKIIVWAVTLTAIAISAFNLATESITSLGAYPLHSSGDHILRLPWGIVFNGWMLSVLLVAGVPQARREIELWLLGFGGSGSKNVLIVGAGDAGEQVARDLTRSTRGAYRPVAYVDPDSALLGHKIHGVPVAATLDGLAGAIEKYDVAEVVIALQRPAPRVLNQIVEQCRRARLNFRIVPPLEGVMSGGINVETLRRVEIEDLLGREPVDLNRDDPPKYLAGRRVLITGAGGSIGLELCRQVLAQRPAELLLLGRGENSIFEALIELDPLARESGLTLQSAIGDVRDRTLIRDTFKQFRPEIVFHAAAHKHVHFMEAQPAEAVKNNVAGTLNVARAAIEAGVQRFIFISTDKAVRPTGIMGATKRIAESVVGSLNATGDTLLVSVRFGNVLGSRGSVIPAFRRQIEQGGPVTVTHPDVTRYFMTTREAVSLVIRAGDQGGGGELFVLDMGTPVKIADLARNLITLSGLEPEADIPIVFTGMRPGEKLTEELLTKEEGVTATENGKIFVARTEPIDWKTLGPQIDELIEAAEAGDEASARALIRKLVPDYSPADR